MVLGFRAGKSASSISPGGVIPERYVSESVVTCTDLQQDEIYILNYECRINDNTNNYGLDLHWRITNDGIDDEMDPSISSYEDILDLPHDIENISFEEISVEPVDYLTYQPHSIMFKPNADYNRMYLFPQAWNISQTGSHWGLINNISITPIIYDDVTTCLPSVTLEQACASQINAISGLTYQWTSNISGAITAGANTLTPTINTTGSPLLTLTVSDGNEVLTTTVQVTYQPITVNCTITPSGCYAPDYGGAIDVTVIGGTSPYTYYWSSDAPPAPINDFFSSDEDISGLYPGNYNFTVTSSEGCVFKDAYDVDDLTLEVNATAYDTPLDESCGIVEIIGVNGPGPYTFLWEDASGSSVGTTQMVTGLAVGLYYYTVTDGVTNCTATGSVEVGIGNSEILADETIYICEYEISNYILTIPTNIAGSTLLWNTGDNTQSITINEFGDYTCNVTTNNGCVFQKTFRVRPYAFDIIDDAESCHEGAMAGVVPFGFSATPGYSNYNWQITAFLDNGTSQTAYYTGENINFWISYGASMLYLTAHVTATSPSGCALNNQITVEAIDAFFDNPNSVPSSTPYPDHYGVWHDVHWIFNNNISIPQGKQLVIKNSIIEFAPGFGFDLSGSGTELVIDNSTITNAYCEDELWKGIMVKGYSNLSHTTANQPKVRVINGSIIENAEKGIYAFYGGMVETDDVTFKNNNYGIFVADYTSYSSVNSTITNTIFINTTEANFITDYNFESFIHLSNLLSFIIQGNTFTNDNYELALMDRGKGIYSVNVGKMKITDNTFNLLTNGVNINNSSIHLQLGEYDNVPRNFFNNNYQGAFLNGIKDLEAVNNKFDDNLLQPTDHAFQMMVSGCFTPNIAHNSFNNGVVGLSLYKPNGYQSGSSFFTYQVYKNSFTNFRIHSNANLNGYPSCITTYGNQGSITFDAGAEIKCNTFKNYDYAIAVMGGEIKMAQGEYSGTNNQAPAGNRFFDDNNMPDGRFFVNAGLNGGYKYYHHAFAPVTKLENYRTISAVADLNGSSGLFVYDNACPDQSPLMSLSIAEIKELIDELKAEIATKKDELFAKVDNGNTDLLLSDIQIANQYNYYGLVFKFFQTQGYLSDASAVAFMQKDVNRDMAKAIAIIANSPLPKAAKSEIDNLDINSYLKDYIWYLQNGENVREQDEKEIQALELRKNSLLQIIKQKAYKDTTGEKYSEAVDVFLEQDEWAQKEDAYHMLKKSPRKNEAPSVFLQLKEDLTKFAEQKRYHMENYLQLLEFGNQIDTLSDSLRVVNITTQEDLLQTIKASEFTEGKMAAEFLLEEAGLDPIEPLFIQLPNPNADRSAAQQDETPKTKSFNFANTPDLIEVYPNPVDDILTVEYIMFNGMSANTLGIYDINGKLLITQKISKAMDILDINVSQLSAGTYIIAFGKDGTTSNSTKFIVK